MVSVKSIPSYGETLARLAPDPAAVAAAAVAVVLAWMLGALILRRSSAAETFASGFGAMALTMTAWGSAGFDLRVGLAILAAAALAGLTLQRRAAMALRVEPLAKTFVLLLPLLLVVSGRIGSEWDEFSHWLRAYRFLVVNNLLPGLPDGPAFDGCCGAYPYGWPILGYAAATLRGFTEAIPALLNIMVIGLGGTLLAGMIAQSAGLARPSWRLLALGLLLATLGQPAFVHKLVFSAYSDVITGFLVAILVLQGERLIAQGIAPDDASEGRWRSGLAFGLSCAALLAVKPGNAGLVLCLLGGMALVILRGGRSWWRALHLGMIPALVLPLAFATLWRWHVGRVLAGKELNIQPPDLWNIHDFGAILAGMIDVASQKGGHFGLGLVVIALGLAALRRCDRPSHRVAIIAATLFIGYNAFLFMTYVVVFTKEDALRAASFWRYNTHIGFALTLPAVIAGGDLARRILVGARWRHWAGRAVVALVLVAPLAAAPWIRFDIDPMKFWMRQTLTEVGHAIPSDQAASVFDPRGSGLSSVVAGYEWGGHPAVAGQFSAFSNSDPKAWIDRPQSTDWMVVMSGADVILGEEVPAAIVFQRVDGRWTERQRYPYPGNQIPAQFP